MSDDASEALLHHTGYGGAIPQAVIEYDGGQFGAGSLVSYRQDVAGAYRAALTWAQRTLAATDN